MFSVLSAWGASLSFFDPRNVMKFFVQVVSTYGRALWIGMPFFIGMIVIDSIIMYTYMGKVSLFFNFESMTSSTLGGALGVALLWQLGSAIFLLSLRKTMIGRSSQSFTTELFRLLQWLLITELVVLVLKIMLIDCGIRVFPQVHWVIASGILICIQSSIFFWLDVRFSLRNIMRVFEKVVNFVFYNLPFFFILCALYIAINYGLSFFLSTNVNESILKLLYSSFIALSTGNMIGMVQFLVVKYLIFLISVIPLTLLFVFYIAKRNEQYAKPFF